MKHKHLVQLLVAKIGIRVHKELILSVSSSNKSLFRDTTVEHLCKFNWSTLLDDFRRTNPTLCAILEPSFKQNKYFPRKPDKNVVLSVIAGILFRNCNQRTNLLQSIVSLMLYSSQAPKQVSCKILFNVIWLYFCKVYSRLQKACLCLSHKSTVTFVDKLGVNYDSTVMNWKDEIFNTLIEVIKCCSVPVYCITQN